MADCPDIMANFMDCVNDDSCPGACDTLLSTISLGSLTNSSQIDSSLADSSLGDNGNSGFAGMAESTAAIVGISTGVALSIAALGVLVWKVRAKREAQEAPEKEGDRSEVRKQSIKDADVSNQVASKANKIVV
jgi:hypothetical protein